MSGYRSQTPEKSAYRNVAFAMHLLRGNPEREIGASPGKMFRSLHGFSETFRFRDRRPSAFHRPHSPSIGPR